MEASPIARWRSSTSWRRNRAVGCGCGGGCGCNDVAPLRSEAPPQTPLAAAGLTSSGHTRALPREVSQALRGSLRGPKAAAALQPPTDPPCSVGALPSGRIDPSALVHSPDTGWMSGQDLLFPGFALAIPRDGNFTPAIEHAHRTLRENRPTLLLPSLCPVGVHLSPGKAGDGRDHLQRGEILLHARGHPGSGMPARDSGAWRTDSSEGATRAPGGEEGVIRAKRRRAAAGSRGVAPGQGGIVRPPESEFMRFAYRDQSFWVRREWFWVYMTADMLLDLGVPEGKPSDVLQLVSSVDDALDALWPEFRARVAGTTYEYEQLLGCYNLHRDDWRSFGISYYFWKTGWGAPLEVFRLSCQLATSFWDFAELEGVNVYADHHFDLCDGFPIFMRRALLGSRLPRRDGEPCRLTVHFRNAEAFSWVNERACMNARACDTGYDPGRGQPGFNWSYFDFHWVSGANCWDGSNSENFCNQPTPASSVGVTDAPWNVSFHPSQLYFAGLTCDRILFLARMCLDYARFDGDTEDIEVAQRISRYALNIAADRCDTLIHEIGHVWLSPIERHCDSGVKCCFDVAASVWLCRVKSFLGLPWFSFGPTPDGDYGPDARTLISFNPLCESCSNDDGNAQHYFFWCDLGDEVGVVGQSAITYATHCWSEEDDPCGS